MTASEALEFWKFKYDSTKNYVDEHWEISELKEHNEYVAALKTAIEALEKQIPKKPYFRVEEDAQGYACPVCDMGVTADKGRIRNTYCSHCGQFLDWSK